MAYKINCVKKIYGFFIRNFEDKIITKPTNTPNKPASIKILESDFPQNELIPTRCPNQMNTSKSSNGKGRIKKCSFEKIRFVSFFVRIQRNKYMAASPKPSPKRNTKPCPQKNITLPTDPPFICLGTLE